MLQLVTVFHELKRIFVEYQTQLNLRLDNLTFEMLGAGESNTNILVNDGEVKLNFNVVVMGNSTHLIDWEWVHIGDPAIDVCKIAWPVATHWQMELNGAERDSYYDRYNQHMADLTLAQRCDVWTIYFMFFDQQDWWLLLLVVNS